jgi:uncharacterized cofD-like protein
MNKKPKVVVIGGGTGIFSVLSGLKNKPVELTAIVSMADSGGSTGQLREEFGVLPPGDIRMALVALSEADQTLSQLFNYRFNGSSLNHSFGNLFLLALSDIKGDFGQGVDEAARILNVQGHIHPITLDDVHLMAELEDGQVIEGETKIDCPEHDPSLRIKRVFYNRECVINPRAEQAILEADLVVIGPGDLFTSIIPNLIVSGMKQILSETRAKKLYFCNLMTKMGETNNFRGEDFVKEIERYLGSGVLDWVAFNSVKPELERIERYEREGAIPVSYDKKSFIDSKIEVLEKDLLRSEGFIRHDLEKTAEVVMEIIKQI